MSEGTAAIRTVAFVVTDCREDASGASVRQSLQVIRGELAPITVVELPVVHLPPLGICALFGQFRVGNGSVLVGGFQRLGVSPDGNTVIFEVTLDFSALAPFGASNPLTADEEGIFVVHADGSGLRRFGPASRAPAQALVGELSATGGFSVYANPQFPFSPNGRLVTFADVGPGPMGEDATQIAILEVATGRRTLVTHLPSAAPPADPFPSTGNPFFIDDETIAFNSRENIDDLNPDHEDLSFYVKTNGAGPSVAFRPPVVLPGSEVVPVFTITGPANNTTFAFPVDGVAENPQPSFGLSSISELLLLEGDRILQLTNFGRVDTAGGTLSNDSQRVFLVASADPFGTNPHENCQIFSIDVLGRDLRQLTQLGAAAHSDTGCTTIPGAACFTGFPLQDQQTGALLFYSTCDPVGANANGGGQIFAMAPDGTDLRQLSHTHGAVAADDGSVDVELPGPIEYSVCCGGELPE